MIRLALAPVTLLVGVGLAPGDEELVNQRRLVEEHYARWVGVPAPEIGPDARDRVAGPAVQLRALRGKRVLLLGVTGAGDFVNAPDKKARAATVEAVARARREQGEKLAVVGFTKSPTPGLPADVPVVMVMNRNFNSPYEILLSGLGGLVIDTKGVITKVYARALTPEDIQEAARIEDWKGETRSAPSTDPWDGKGPPRPRLRAVKAWSRTHRVVGGTGGDWNLDGAPDLLALAPGRLLVLSPEDGAVREEVKVAAIRDRHETVRWAELEKGVSALLHFPGGWPHTVPAIGKDGKVLWSYPPGRGGGIDAVDWVDLDGDGRTEALIGFNGRMGLHLVSSRGEKLWETGEVGNVWAVAGIEAAAGQPGLAFCTSVDGKVHVFDASGHPLRSLENQGLHVVNLGARNLNAAGDRQVVSLGEPLVGQGAVAVGQDPEGKLLWKFPLGREHPRRAVHAADLTGDGVLEWVLEWPDQGAALVLDAKGALLAKLELADRFTACFPVQRKAKPAILCVATPMELRAFTLEP